MGIVKTFEGGLKEFTSHSVLQNALINNDNAPVNVIKQSLKLKFGKTKKVSQDYLLKLV